MYEYSCKVQRVVDGDTVDVLIDLGFEIYVGHRVRLEGIDAPESRTRDLVEKQKGLAATGYLKGLFDVADEVKIITSYDKRGKYGRVIGTFFVKRDGAWGNVNEMLVEDGHAVAKEY